MEELNFIIGFTFSALVVLLVMLALFLIWSNKLEKQLKDLKDNQFDAKQVMEMYQQKFNRPIVFENRADVIELKREFSVPWDIYKQLDEKEFDDYITKQLCNEFADAITPFIEYRADNDYRYNRRVVHSRIRVVARKQ